VINLTELWIGFTNLARWDVLLILAAAVPIGLVFGILPGLGGLVALAVLLPLVYGMEPIVGLAFLLGSHAVISTGGSVTSILLGIPGSPSNAATVLDGYALSRRGRAGYALGAALGSSALGGIIGALVLFALLPVVRPVVMSFGSPETFFLALLGISYLAMLGGGSPVKGLAAGALGLFLGTFGYQHATGVPRFWMNFDYLLDGFRLIPLALGMFAIPEIVDLMSGRSIAAKRPDGSAIAITHKQVWLGTRASIVRKWVLIRSALLGVFLGIIPGVGSETAPFVTYGAAKQASKRPYRFGKGSIEGVIGPEGANNAKDGGALVPTLAFGIPGSSSMVLLLGGFLLLGLQPGPKFLEENMDLAYSMAFLLVAANVIGALALLLLAKYLAKITLLPGHLMAPILMSLVVVGAYSGNNDFMDVLFVFIFGALAIAMRAYGFSRPALLLGFVLAPMLETYLYISLNTFGPTFFMRPICLLLSVLIIGGAVLAFMKNRRERKAAATLLQQTGRAA
jgi:putative tricarboxylic transport membrane protein